MSQLSSGAPGRFLRDRGFPLKPLAGGVDGSLVSPGLAEQPAVSEGAQLAGQLAQALGMVGDLAQNVGQFARATAAAEERKRLEQERLDREAADYDRARGNLNYDKFGPSVRAKIERGEIIPADTPEGINEQIDEMVLSATDGAPAAYREQFRKRATAEITDWLTQAQTAHRDRAWAENMGELNYALDEPGITPERVKELEATAFRHSPGRTENVVRGALVLPAAERAAARGDEAHLKTLLGALPPEQFATQHQALTNKAAEVSRLKRQRDEMGARDQIIGAADAGASYEALTRQIDEAQARGVMDNTTAAALSSQFLGRAQERTVTDIQRRILNGTITPAEVESQVKAASNLPETDPRYIKPSNGASLINAVTHEDAAAIKRAERRAFEEQTVNEAAAHLISTAVTGGASTWTDRVHEFKDGTRETVDSKRAITMAVDRIFAGYDAETAREVQAAAATPDVRPEFIQRATAEANRANFNRKAKFLSDSGATYEPWTNLLNGGPTQINIETLSRMDQKGEAPALPAGVTASFSLWEQLGQNPALRNRLTTSGRARFLYSTAEMVKRYVPGVGDDTPRAMMIALQATSDRDGWSESISSMLEAKELRKAAIEVADGSPHIGDVSREIENLARFAMSPALSLGRDEALEWAKGQVKAQTSVLNGWPVPTAGVHVPPNLPEIASLFADEYAADWLARTGNQSIEASDLTLRPIGVAQWLLVYGRDGTPVEDWQTKGLFTGATIQGAVQRAIANSAERRRRKAKEEEPMRIQQRYQREEEMMR